MITNEKGIKIIWPDRWDICRNNYIGYDEATVMEQSIGKWDWVKMRLQKATAADEKNSCNYVDCDDPVTIENKENYKEAERTNDYTDFQSNKIKTFLAGEYVIREQWSAQTFNTLHVMCAVRKLQKIQSELDEGIIALMDATYSLIDEGIPK